MKRIAGIVLSVMLCATLAEARFQRMAMARGSYRIAPQSAARVTAYCVDYTRATPNTSVSYSHLLSAPERVRVKIGNRTYSGTEALSKKLISITGNDATLGSMIDRARDPLHQRRLSPSDRQKLLAALREFDALPPEMRALYRRQELGGDSSGLRVHNHTNEEVTLTLSGPVIAGERAESVQSVLPAIESIDPRAVPETAQGDLWRSRNMQHQAMLQRLGLYEGRIDGEFGPRSHEALREFQRRNKLAQNKQIDDPTESLLMKQFEDARLRQINARETGVLLARVAYRPAKAGQEGRFTLEVGDADSRFQSASASDIAVELVRQATTRNSSTVYLEMENMNATRQDGLAATVRMQSAASAERPMIRPFSKGKAPVELQELCFAERPTISEPRFTDAAETSAKFQVKASVYGRARSAVLRVKAKAKEILAEFISMLKARMASKPASSLAELVPQIKRELQTKHNLSDEDLTATITSDLGAIQLASK